MCAFQLDIDWSKQPLGEISDADLAKRLGIGWRTVYRRRTELGIESNQAKTCLKVRAPVELLGTMTDKEFAKRYKTQEGRIASWRKQLGIPCFGNKGKANKKLGEKPKRAPRRYDVPEELLGKVSDREIAQTLGCHFTTVQGWRRQRGIAPAAALGEYDIPEELLGKVSDVKIAKKLGCHFTTVKKWRVDRGIAPCNEAARKERIDWKTFIHLIPLGEIADEEIADVLSISPGQVSSIRVQFDIKSFHHRPVCPCGNNNNRNQSFCSTWCNTTVRNLASQCGIDRSNEYEARDFVVDELIWAIAELQRSYCRLDGSITTPAKGLVTRKKRKLILTKKTSAKKPAAKKKVPKRSPKKPAAKKKGAAKKKKAKKTAPTKKPAKRKAKKTAIVVEVRRSNNLSKRLESTDDLLSDILECNDRLNSGQISIQQARTLTGNFKVAVKLISQEISLAKFTGRTSKTIKRWFKRIDESEVEAAQPSSVLAQLAILLEEEKASASKSKSKRN